MGRKAMAEMSYAPAGAEPSRVYVPTAYAVGYSLPPGLPSRTTYGLEPLGLMPSSTSERSLAARLECRTGGLRCWRLLIAGRRRRSYRARWKLGRPGLPRKRG